MRPFPRDRFRVRPTARMLLVAAPTLLLAGSVASEPRAMAEDSIVVIAFNDLGMHCMNEEFSEFVILPPFNTLRAQVLKRGNGPDILDEHVTITYAIPTNTRSVDKTNFWTHAEALFGVALPPDIGLTGNGMTGTLELVPGTRHYEASGIPITPVDDSGRLNPYPLAAIEAVHDDGFSASTVTVVPVSTELSCHLCHQTPGVSTATDILRDHDALHGTDLEQHKPVLCAGCHADVALGLPGDPDLPNLSLAIHAAHAPRMDLVSLDNECYACHPGTRTKCQRDVHFGAGIQCTDCHGGMTSVGDPDRQPWLDQPRCGDCHDRPGFDFEEPGKLFKDSRGHGGVMCAACHGSPHAITPAVTEADNQQSIVLQGHSGVINDCLVCHREQPDESFFHKIDD